MRHALAAVALAAVALVVAGCGGGTNPPADMARGDLAQPLPFCSDGADGGPPASYASMQRIFGENCAVPSCHNGGPVPLPGGGGQLVMDLRADHFYETLVNVPAKEACGGVRVVPGQPDKSYAYHKLVDAMPCAGNQMPQSEVGAFPLPKCATDLIRAWIQAGAPKM